MPARISCHKQPDPDPVFGRGKTYPQRPRLPLSPLIPETRVGTPLSFRCAADSKHNTPAQFPRPSVSERRPAPAPDPIWG